MPSLLNKIELLPDCLWKLGKIATKDKKIRAFEAASPTLWNMQYIFAIIIIFFICNTLFWLQLILATSMIKINPNPPSHPHVPLN